MEHSTTVCAETRALAAACSSTQWADAPVLRAQLLPLPQHHQHAVFSHLLTLVPLNTLLTTCPFNLLQPIVSALLLTGSPDATVAQHADSGGSAAPHAALHLPASAPGARSTWGAAPLTPAAYGKLFSQFPVLPHLTSVCLAGDELGGEGVMAAATALCAHVQLTHLNLRKNGSDVLGLSMLSDVLPCWPALRALLLSGNDLLSTQAADALAPGLHALPQLTWLDVRPTRMTDALRAALEPLTAMLELGSPRFRHALTRMVHLSHLDLGLPGFLLAQAPVHDGVLNAVQQAQLAEHLRVHKALRWLNSSQYVRRHGHARFPAVAATAAPRCGRTT
jgi:hypothetical protein